MKEEKTSTSAEESSSPTGRDSLSVEESESEPPVVPWGPGKGSSEEVRGSDYPQDTLLCSLQRQHPLPDRYGFGG